MVNNDTVFFLIAIAFAFGALSAILVMTYKFEKDYQRQLEEEHRAHLQYRFEKLDYSMKKARAEMLEKLEKLENQKRGEKCLTRKTR